MVGSCKIMLVFFVVITAASAETPSDPKNFQHNVSDLSSTIDLASAPASANLSSIDSAEHKMMNFIRAMRSNPASLMSPEKLQRMPNAINLLTKFERNGGALTSLIKGAADPIALGNFKKLSQLHHDLCSYSYLYKVIYIVIAEGMMNGGFVPQKAPAMAPPASNPQMPATKTAALERDSETADSSFLQAAAKLEMPVDWVKYFKTLAIWSDVTANWHIVAAKSYLSVGQWADAQKFATASPGKPNRMHVSLVHTYFYYTYAWVQNWYDYLQLTVMWSKAPVPNVDKFTDWVGKIALRYLWSASQYQLWDAHWQMYEMKYKVTKGDSSSLLNMVKCLLTTNSMDALRTFIALNIQEELYIPATKKWQFYKSQIFMTFVWDSLLLGYIAANSN